ncbi:carboxymuconolactone decarboxylase family protein [Microbaculum marinum]|uniref:Carboxymuconolactone decarboxylase family protein n=1 Tax=Microbaculum marinum TaxID=1764581 RepID=A0AAW9RQ08_9HYPH
MTGPRISLPDFDDLNAAQRRVYEDVVRGPRGRVSGPLRAVIHSPDLADRWQRLGEFLRFDISLPHALKELAILVTARRWNAELEWTIHARAARDYGLSEGVIEAIRRGEPPDFADAEQADVYAFARELQLHGRVADDSYAAILSRWGETGVVELTALVGYYTMVAMTLNAHRIPLPGDSRPELLPEGGPEPWQLSDIPAASPEPT